jgi:hypothetical protein
MENVHFDIIGSKQFLRRGTLIETGWARTRETESRRIAMMIAMRAGSPLSSGRNHLLVRPFVGENRGYRKNILTLMVD